MAKSKLLWAKIRAYDAYPSSMLRSKKKDFEIDLNLIEGSIPQDIHGYAFLTEGFSDESKIFVKAGKGAINRIDFNASRPLWKRRLIQTPSVQISERLNDEKYKFKPMGQMVYQNAKLGFMNTANTNAVPMGDGRLALTFEGGRHWELDPKSLKLLSPIGRRDEWQSAVTGIASKFNGNPLFPSLRTTAHPYYDKELNEFITLNYASKVRISLIALGRPFTKILKWDRQGDLRSWNIVNAKNGRNVEIKNTSHSFLVTRNYVGIVDTPARVEAEMFIGLKSLKPCVPYTKIWWLKRSDLEDGKKNVPAREYTLKREFIDLVCDYDDSDGVTVYSGSIQSSDQTEFLRKDDKLFVGGTVRPELEGLSSGPNDLSGFVKLKIQMNGDQLRGSETFITDNRDLWGIDFPAFRGNYAFPEKFKTMYWSTVGYNPDQILERLVDLYKDQKYRNIPVSALPKTNHGAAIIQLDCETFGIENRFIFPSTAAIGSLQFVPKLGSSAQNEGYLISMVSLSEGFNSSLSSGQELWIFDGET